MAKENVKKSVPLLIPITKGPAAEAPKPRADDEIKKSLRLYIEVK